MSAEYEARASRDRALSLRSDGKVNQRFCKACGKYKKNYTYMGFKPPKDKLCSCAPGSKYVPGQPRYCAICGGRMKLHEVACGDKEEFQMRDGEKSAWYMDQMPDKNDPIWRK